MANDSSEVANLKDSIAFNEVLLRSLEDETDVDPARDDIVKELDKLKSRLRAAQQLQPNSQRSATDDNSLSLRHRPSSSTDSFASNHSPNGSQQIMPPPISTSLPNRKRVATHEDDDGGDDEYDFPQTKLPRTADSQRMMRGGSVDSVDTDISTDSFFRNFLGSDYKEQSKKDKELMKRLEDKRLQEEEDARFARQLQETWERENISLPVQKPALPSFNASQSYLKPDGSYQQHIPKSLNRNVKIEATASAPSGTLTPSSDDSSGLEEISSWDWTTKFGSRTDNDFSPSHSAFSPSIPGAFPGLATNPYASSAGSSVYGNYGVINPYATYSAGLPGPYNPSNGMNSLNMPIDLDAYPTPSFSPATGFYPDPEKTQEEIRDLLKHIRPDEELTPEQLAEVQPEGLNVDLMPHQRKGFAWMKSMEDGTNKGGILADDMGLGKTIQALSLILARKAKHGSHRPTLVVAPVALMQQWEREIKKFVKHTHRLDVLILHQENRNKPWNFIRDYDVVLTTYGTLASEFKRKTLWDKHVALVPDAKPKPQQTCPLMGDRSYFHRIILDEAQNIKNKSTKAAAAACHLQADFRWCLSGTPMQNNVDEIYSLIKFCRIRPYHDYDKFAKDISRPLKRVTTYGKDSAMQKLQVLLRAVLLRRTKKSEIDGKPIVQLPEKHTVEERAIFTKDELDFYKALETQSQIQFNRFLKKGSIGRHYSHALVLLLRLRQCCCSAQLITNAPDFMSTGVIEDVDYIENAKSLPASVIKRLDDNDGFECPICMDAVENPLIFNPCGHIACQECLTSMTEKAMEDASSKLTCPHCRGELNINLVTTHESYLRVYHPEREGVRPLEDEDEDGGEEDSDSDSSSDDDIEDEDDDGEDLKDFIVPDDDDIEYDSEESEDKKSSLFKHLKPNTDTKDKVKAPAKVKQSKKGKSNKEKSKGKGKGKAKKKFTSLADLRKEGLKSKAAKKKYLKKLAKGWQPSAKIDKTVELLQEIRDRGEGEKTIIFSSFTSFLDLVEVPLSRDEGLANYVRYDGSMKTQDRTEAVVRFTDDPKCTVILVSLKAGNSGLNLTAANHVILLDPFWNPFVEYQAADRCYRIGQMREVTIHRILIGDENDHGNAPAPDKDFTVEDRILKLQEKKKLLVETALDEKAATGFSRLSTRDLGYLFGVNPME